MFSIGLYLSSKKYWAGDRMRELPLTIENVVELSSPQVGLAVLGHPINHSISPILHHAALENLASTEPSFADWTYERFDVKPENLEVALNRLSKSGYLGLNLTIPHKVEVLGLLNGLDREASLIGAVNTLIFRDGEWYGQNTDGYGLQKALENELNCDLAGSQILILGAGGAARAAAVQSLLAGARNVHIHNRSSDRLNDLLNFLSNEFDGGQMSGSTPDDVRCEDFIGQNWIIINATSLGLNAMDSSPLFMSCSEFGKGTVVYDMIYNPPQTSLLTEAEKAGYKCANGLSMLIYQAAKSLEIWTDRAIAAEAMFEAANNHIRA